MITVDQQKIDDGYIQFGSDKSLKICFSNTGSGLLRSKKESLPISKIKKSTT
jgi:hypothetical protein